MYTTLCNSSRSSTWGQNALLIMWLCKMSEEKKRVECPICGKDFLKNMINMHVDNCLTGRKQTEGGEASDAPTTNASEGLSAPKRQKVCNSSGEASSSSGTNKANVSQSKQAWKNIFSTKSTNGADSKGKSDPEPSRVLSNTGVHFAQITGSGMSLTNTSTAPSFEQLAKAATDSRVHKSMPNSMSVPVKLDLAKLDASPKTSNSSHQQKTSPLNQLNRSKVASGNSNTSTSKNSQDVGQSIPLSEQMRPKSLEEFIGQTHLLGKNKMLRTLLVSYQIPSMILWGPPGCGKVSPQLPLCHASIQI